MADTKFTCNECDASFRDPGDNFAGDLLCPQCKSTDISKVRTPSQDELHAAEDASRAEFAKLRERREYWDRQYAGMDFFAVASDITTADTGTMPRIDFTRKQAS